MYRNCFVDAGIDLLNLEAAPEHMRNILAVLAEWDAAPLYVDDYGDEVPPLVPGGMRKLLSSIKSVNICIRDLLAREPPTCLPLWAAMQAGIYKCTLSDGRTCSNLSDPPWLHAELFARLLRERELLICDLSEEFKDSLKYI